MKIVTGRTGKAHVTSADDRVLHQGIWGQDGMFFESESAMIDANTFRAMPIDILFQGCLARVLPGEYEDLTIDNGVSGQKRIDLIVARYSIDAEGIESMNLVVLKGTPVTGANTPKVPAYKKGYINKGARIVDMPLWKIPINGLAVGDPVRVAKILPSLLTESMSIEELQGNLKKSFDIAQTEIDDVRTIASEARAAAGEAQGKAESAINTAGAASNAAQSAKQSVDSLAQTVNSVQNDVDSNTAAIGANAKAIATNANAIAVNTKKITVNAKTGRVISASSRLKYTLEGKTSGIGSFTDGTKRNANLTVPAGTNGMFMVQIGMSGDASLLGYTYSINEEGKCDIDITIRNNQTEASSIELIAIFVGPISALVAGAQEG